MHYDFVRDLKEGEAAENEVLARVSRYVPKGFKSVPDHGLKTHDLLFVNPFEGRRLLIEVKWDQYSERSGNIAVEYQCSGKWSGIATTQAQVWVFKYFRGMVWRLRAVETDTLRAAWRSKQFRMVNGGDNNRARMFLVPLDIFETWGVQL